jgi:HD-like signal output (HDOD) protein
MANLLETVEREIISALESDQLVLPSLPEAALQIREVAQDEDSSVADLAGVIARDAAISARIIKVCNSPLLRAPQPVENLHMAINRLGMSYSADLAVGLAMQHMFQATSDLIDSRMRDVWTQSTDIAGICHMLAQSFTRLSPAQAMLAGLTHKIGVLPILRFAEENDHLLSDGFTLDEITDKLHPKLGQLILKAWDFSDELCSVPAQYLDFERQSARADLTDIVTVAYLQNLTGTNHPFTKLDWSTIPAFMQLGISTQQDEEEEEDLSANMKAALDMLS